MRELKELDAVLGTIVSKKVLCIRKPFTCYFQVFMFFFLFIEKNKTAVNALAGMQ
jgi:hypothetical protein